MIYNYIQMNSLAITIAIVVVAVFLIICVAWIGDHPQTVLFK